jgi:hypothetical protein
MSHVTASAGQLYREAGGANGVVWAGFNGAASLRCRRLLLVCVWRQATAVRVAVCTSSSGLRLKGLTRGRDGQQRGKARG